LRLALVNALTIFERGKRMPELPEVEVVCRGLKRTMSGRAIAEVRLKRGDLRFPFPAGFADRLIGRKVKSVKRRAKYIVVSLSDDTSLLMHLGMSGHFTVFRPGGSRGEFSDLHFTQTNSRPGTGPHDHVAFVLDDKTEIVYTDPRRFGLMDLLPSRTLLSHRLIRPLGVEPLSSELNTHYLATVFATKKAPLKSVLVDQRLIAGLGNIYACEALFRARLSPHRKAGTLVKGRRFDARLRKLVHAIRAVLNDAIESGGSTIRDYARADGSSGAYQQRFWVYGRVGKPCRRRGCGGTVRRLVQSGRSTFFCPTCQR
jgi:formamidopyrimidine-DNA glycosylase